MFENSRESLRQSATPRVVVVALLVALAETAAGLAAGVLAAEVTPALPGGQYLFAVPLTAEALVSMAVWLPVASFVLAGFYGALGETPDTVRESLRAFVRVGRREYRRYLTAAVVSAVLGIVLVLAVWAVLVAVFLVASTGFDYLRYANGARFAARPMLGVAATALLLVLAGLVSSVAFVFTGPLVVRTDVDARRAPLAALQFVRDRPRTALPAACAAAIAFTLPTAVGTVLFERAKPPEPTWASEVSQYQSKLLYAALATLAVVLLLATLVRALVGPLLVHITDKHADPDATPSLSALVPSRRTVAVTVVVLLVGTSAAAVRVADVHPHNPPESGIELEQAPSDVYTASADLTMRSARRANSTVVTRHPNGSVESRVSFVTAWDSHDAQATVTADLYEDDPPASLYVSERTYALQQPGTLSLPNQRAVSGRTVNGWLVIAAPIYAPLVDPSGFDQAAKLANAEPQLTVVERTTNQLVLGANGSAAARLSEYYGAERYDFENATFRAVLDPETGYLQRLQLSGVVVEYADNGSVLERRHRTRTVTYRDVGSTDVQRPDIGSPGVLEHWWDVLYY